ncbi:hypothetical protein LXL04_003525 [Taraxacum kok-saghyz]
MEEFTIKMEGYGSIEFYWIITGILRGDLPFCSEEYRGEQIEIDEEKEKKNKEYDKAIKEAIRETKSVHNTYLKGTSNIFGGKVASIPNVDSEKVVITCFRYKCGKPGMNTCYCCLKRKLCWADQNDYEWKWGWDRGNENARSHAGVYSQAWLPTALEDLETIV